MRYEHTTDVVIVGGGPAGIGAAYALEKYGGVQVTLLDAAFPSASFLNNQHWLQSGLFYLNNRALASKLWHGYPAIQRLAEKFLIHRGAYFLGLEETLQERITNAVAWGIPVQRIPYHALPHRQVLGAADCVGGLVAPDCAVDFTAFLAFLRVHLVTTQVIVPARVMRLLADRQNHVCAVLYQHTGDEVLLKCRWCIVSAGAWTVELLQESFGIALPVKRFKSHIVTFAGRLVDTITAFLDGTQLTLVPIGSRTLVANARRVLAEDAAAACTPIPSEVAILKEQLATAFPRLRWSALQTQLVDGHG